MGAAQRLVFDTWSAFNHVERTILFFGSVLCGFICVWTSQLLGVPREPGFSGSLLASGLPVTSMIAAAISIAICTIVGSLIAAYVEIEAGVFCCCMGLAALGVHSGGIRPVLQYANGPSVFLLMAVEALILAIVVCGVWFMMSRLFDWPQSSETDGIRRVAPNEISDATLSQKLAVTGVQVVVMGVCELILLQTDAKAQAMAGVSLSAFFGVMAAYMFMPIPEGIWYWIGPTMLGAIGFALAYFGNGATGTGDVNGWSAALARATPLDYAGMGTAGALLAYWCSRRWAQPEESSAEVVTE